MKTGNKNKWKPNTPFIYLEGMNKQLTNSYMKVQQGKQALLLTWVVQFYLGLDKIHRPWRHSNGGCQWKGSRGEWKPVTWRRRSQTRRNEGRGGRRRKANLKWKKKSLLGDCWVHEQRTKKKPGAEEEKLFFKIYCLLFFKWRVILVLHWIVGCTSNFVGCT